MRRRDFLRGGLAVAASAALPAPGRAQGGDAVRAILNEELRSGRPCRAQALAIKGTLSRMDRTRAPVDGRSIVVDLPSQTLNAYEGTTSVLDSVVVVGDPDWRTPDLDTTVAFVRFNPTWTVPKSIVDARDWTGKLRRDPGYFSRLDFLVTADGRTMRPEEAAARGARDVRFVQQPGARNALGAVKFGLDAGQAVYLHDTNDKNGFDEDQRALSHGCMRVERALDLAAWALRMDPAEARRHVDGDDRADHRTDGPVRVLTTYFTAWPDRDGKVAYYDDVYARDGGGAGCGGAGRAVTTSAAATAPRGGRGAPVTMPDGDGTAAYVIPRDYEVAE